MPGQFYNKLYEIALDQHGYVTAEQAGHEGVSRQTLAAMRRRGTLERVSWGVYRVSSIPTTRLSSYMEASLWPNRTRAVLSHETALDLLELSDVNPSKIHMMVPRGFRPQRAVPAQYVLHFDELDPKEIGYVEGIPVTTASRAIRDCHATHVGSELLLRAVVDGLRRGYLRKEDADSLQKLITSNT